jgi:hypothetical protein
MTRTETSGPRRTVGDDKAAFSSSDDDGAIFGGQSSDQSEEDNGRTENNCASVVRPLYVITREETNVERGREMFGI